MGQAAKKILLVEDSLTFGRLLQKRVKSELKSEVVWAKILVVDDSMFWRTTFLKLFKIQQYQVLTAIHGEDAMVVLNKNPDIKLMLVDYYMPVMDGNTLCQKVRELYKKEEVAIIGISASENQEMAARFLKSGANDYILKESFLVEEFYCRINQSIDNVFMFAAIQEAAIKDFLTGLYNRRYFFDHGEKLFLKSMQDETKLACAMIDIDFFKKVNDTYGHDVGDLVIQKIASILQNSTVNNNMAARLGGEEFCLLFHYSTIEDANQFFTTLCKEVENTQILYDGKSKSLKITISIGVCTDSLKSLHLMVNKSDELLYLAKNQGRNQVVFSS